MQSPAEVRPDPVSHPLTTHKKKPVASAYRDTFNDLSATTTIGHTIRHHKGAWTGKGLAAVSGLKLKTLYDWSKQERMPSIRLPGKVMFDPKTTADWWEKHCTKQAA